MRNKPQTKITHLNQMTNPLVLPVVMTLGVVTLPLLTITGLEDQQRIKQCIGASSNHTVIDYCHKNILG